MTSREGSDEAQEIVADVFIPDGERQDDGAVDRQPTAENGVVVAYANHCGPGFTGLSCIATPFGRNAVLLGDEPGVGVLEVPPGALERARGLNTYLRDVP